MSWSPVTHYGTHTCPVCGAYSIIRQEFNQPYTEILACGCELTMSQLTFLDIKMIADGGIMVMWDEVEL